MSKYVWRIELLAQDYSKTLFTTSSQSAAAQFLRDSGETWLPMRIEWGQRTWRQRWAGRIELHDDGSTSMHSGSEYLSGILVTESDFSQNPLKAV